MPPLQARADLLTTLVSDAMVALNAAMMTDGVVITVADRPGLTEPTAHRPYRDAVDVGDLTRSLIRVGSSAHLSLVESYVGADRRKPIRSMTP